MAKRILLKCPKGHRRELGVEAAGTNVSCLECGHVWKIPAAPPVELPLVDVAPVTLAPAACAPRAATPAPAQASPWGNLVVVGTLMLGGCCLTGLVLSTMGVGQEKPLAASRIKRVLSGGSLRDTATLWYRADRAPIGGRTGYQVAAGQRVLIFEGVGAYGDTRMERVRTESGEEGWISRMQLEDLEQP